MKLATYRKTIVALVGGVLAWGQVAYVPDGSLSRDEWYGLAVALATALGVYGITNRQDTSAPVVDVPIADDYPEAVVDVPAEQEVVAP